MTSCGINFGGGCWGWIGYFLSFQSNQEIAFHCYPADQKSSKPKINRASFVRERLEFLLEVEKQESKSNEKQN